MAAVPMIWACSLPCCFRSSPRSPPKLPWPLRDRALLPRRSSSRQRLAGTGGPPGRRSLHPRRRARLAGPVGARRHGRGGGRGRPLAQLTGLVLRGGSRPRAVGRLGRLRGVAAPRTRRPRPRVGVPPVSDRSALTVPPRPGPVVVHPSDSPSRDPGRRRGARAQANSAGLRARSGLGQVTGKGPRAIFDRGPRRKEGGVQIS